MRLLFYTMMSKIYSAKMEKAIRNYIAEGRPEDQFLMDQYMNLMLFYEAKRAKLL